MIRRWLIRLGLLAFLILSAALIWLVAMTLLNQYQL
jgi:hypothetical protein